MSAGGSTQSARLRVLRRTMILAVGMTLLVSPFGCTDNSLKGRVRLLLASSAFPALELLLNEDAVASGASVGASRYVTVDSKAFDLALREAGTSMPFYALPVVVDRGADYTLFVAGERADPRVSWAKDDNEPLSGDRFRYRVYNGFKSDTAFDIYLLRRDDDVEDFNPVVLGIPYANRTGYLTGVPDLLKLVVTKAGEKTVLGSLNVQPGDDETHTFVVSEGEAAAVVVTAILDAN